MPRYMRKADEIFDMIDKLFDEFNNEKTKEKRYIINAQIQALMWVLDNERKSLHQS